MFHKYLQGKNKMKEFIFPSDWDELLEKEAISPNEDFNNFCEDYNQEDFDEILR